MSTIVTKRGRFLLGFLGLILVSAPIIGAEALIANHTRARAQHEVTSLVEEGITHAETAIDQGLSALSDLSVLGVSDCSDRALDLMRRAVYANYSIKEVGVINPGGELLCNHIGDIVSVKRISPPFNAESPDVSLRLVELGAGDHVGVMLVWTVGKESGLSAVVPSEALIGDAVPLDLRDTAVGRLVLPDGTAIGPLGAAPVSVDPAPAESTIAAEARSRRYPIAASLAVPFETFRQQDRTLVTYARIGGIVASSLIFALLVYLLRRPPGIIGELTEAAERGEFVPYYQPVVDVRSGELVGCEVLIRWHKSDGTVLPPSDFIAFAEASGLANQMTVSLMRLVRADLEDAFADRRHLKIAVNLFHAHFTGLGTVDDVERIFGASPIGFDQLVFELTERQPLADIERAKVVIRHLQELGARVALDDAGAGHAGLAYLQQLHVDIVKIDKLFIDTIDTEHGAPIVDSLIKLGHDLGMEVVAEGVETAAQLQYLKAHGADSAQGYLFSPPLPAAPFLELVARMDRPVAERGPVLGAAEAIPAPSTRVA